MLNNLKPTCGSRKESKRRCRGIGSGIGKNGGTGNKGQKSRGTGKVALGFEGGQLPLLRRLPKRGFKNVNRVEYAVVNLDVLDKFENGSKVDLCALVSKGYVDKEYCGLKVLGNGTTLEEPGICDNLRFLGNDIIHPVILKYANELGILKKEP